MRQIFSWRIRRQLSALLLVFLVIGGFGLWVVARSLPEASCFDGRRNRGEVGIDCGGPCAPCELANPKPLSIFWARSVRASGEAYDAVALVENANDVLSSAAVEYEFTLLDKFGVIGRRPGTTFIYPQERLYIVEPNIRTSREALQVEFAVRKVAWQAAGAPRPSLVVERRAHVVREENGKMQSVVEAQILNAGPYRFREMEVHVAVFDEAGNVIGANRIVAEDIFPGERRTVRSIWPEPLPGDAARIEVYPRVNLFDPAAIVLPE